MGKQKSEDPGPYKKRKTSSDNELVIPVPDPSEIELIASGFPDSISESRIEKLFKSCGTFSIRIPKDSKGVVFLRFFSEKSAKKALSLSGGTYKGRALLINRVSDLPKVAREKQTPVSVFVGNLNTNTTEAQLISFFSGAGKVKSIRLNSEKAFAHVDFTNRYSAELAEKLAGGKLNGQRIKIEIASKKSSSS